MTDFSLQLPFLTFPKVGGGITHPPFLVNKHAHIPSITVYLYLVPGFREDGNLQLEVSATINQEEGDNIDIGELGSASTCKRDRPLHP